MHICTTSSSFSNFKKYNKAEYLASNHHQLGLGLPLMFGDTRDDISKVLPSTVIALYIPLVALIYPPPVAINVVTPHWALSSLVSNVSERCKRFHSRHIPPIVPQIVLAIAGGPCLSIVPRIAPKCRHSGCSRAAALSIVLPYLQPAKAHAGCRVVDTR